MLLLFLIALIPLILASCDSSHTVADFLVGTCTCTSGQLWLLGSAVAGKSPSQLLAFTSTASTADSTNTGCLSTALTAPYCTANASPLNPLVSCAVPSGTANAPSATGWLPLYVQWYYGNETNGKNSSYCYLAFWLLDYCDALFHSNLWKLDQ